jgi:pimeloyl-ACP methyl ester carboxylesterase
MQLFFRQFGKGKPVVILHGFLGLSDNWVTFGRRLGEKYSVYIPDMRDHGRSPHSDCFDFPSMVNDLLEMTGAWGLKEVNLIGHSLGGETAMLFALQNPEKVKKMVIVDMGLRKPFTNHEHLMLLDAMLAIDFSKVSSRGDVDKQLLPYINNEKLRQFLLKNVCWRDRQTMDWRLDLKSINENMPALFERLDYPGTYHGPVMFIRGGRSDYILDGDIPEIKIKFPGAIMETIENASHWVQADAPGEFYTLVRNFLDGDQ